MSPSDQAESTTRRAVFDPSNTERAQGAPRSEKRSEIVAREIVRDISSRKLPPGSKLPAEADMLATYGVGRATLREALRVLEVQGIISIKPGPGGGPVVGSAHPKDFGRMATLYLQLLGATFRELADARLALEPLMARLAAERRDYADVEGLTEALGRAAVVTLDEDASWAQVSTEFHGRIASMSGNPILDLIALALKEVWVDRITGAMVPRQDRNKVQSDHDEIVRAIIEGDGERAEDLMRQHMEEFVAYYAQRNPGMLDEVVDWR